VATDCVCPLAQFCERHDRHMARLHWNRCQSGESDVLSAMYSKVNNNTIQTSKSNSGRTTQEKKSTIGDNLHNIIRRETGNPVPCSECKKEIDRLNSMTASEVLLDCIPLAERIVARSSKNAQKWYQRAAAKYLPGMVTAIVRGWIVEACGVPSMPAVVPAEHVVGCIHDGKVAEFKALTEVQGIIKWKFGNVDPNHHRRVIDLSGSPELLIDTLKIVNDGYERPQYETPFIPGSWQYAVTTVRQRASSTLPETLRSLSSSGFTKPFIAVDGPEDSQWISEYGNTYHMIYRGHNAKSYAHWYLTLQELYLRNPYAQYYAIFQDDFVCVPNLKAYLESCEYPEKGYWNLFTFMENDDMVSTVSQKGWLPAARAVQGHQLGRGAVALVFSQEAVLKLLSSQYLLTRIMDAVKGHKSIDGAVVTAMNMEGWTEYIHNPSLIQHTGEVSSMGNRKHPISKCYVHDFDPLTIL